jgi:hypothetical protein
MKHTNGSFSPTTKVDKESDNKDADTAGRDIGDI